MFWGQGWHNNVCVWGGGGGFGFWWGGGGGGGRVKWGIRVWVWQGFSFSLMITKLTNHQKISCTWVIHTCDTQDLIIIHTNDVGSAKDFQVHVDWAHQCTKVISDKYTSQESNGHILLWYHYCQERSMQCVLFSVCTTVFTLVRVSHSCFQE